MTGGGGEERFLYVDEDRCAFSNREAETVTPAAAR